MRVYIKKLCLKSTFSDLEKLYSAASCTASSLVQLRGVKVRGFEYILLWSAPRRQQFMHLITIADYKQRVLTAGKFLVKALKKPKFYRTSLRGVNHYYLFLKTNVFSKYPKIYLMRVKRFTGKQMKLYAKFVEAVKPRIRYLTCGRSYNKHNLYRRRLKRYVWRIVKLR